MNVGIEHDARVEQWLELIEAAEATRKTYTTYIKAYAECIGKSPTELIDEAITETKAGKLLSERNTVIYMTKFKKCLNDQRKAPKTQGVAFSTIQSFYKTFDIQLSSVIGKKKKRLPLQENQYFLTKDDVKNLLTNAKNLRTRAIILCMATSGMAKNEILNLRLRDITFDEQGIGIINIRRQKAQVDYVTFLSPEAVKVLNDYLNERSRDVKLKVKGVNDFVFVTYGEKLSHGQKKGSGIGSKIADQTFTNEFKKLGEDLGYGNGKGNFVKSRSHSLRKFFASTLENAGMPKNKIDFMLGHTPSGNDLAYFKTDVEALKSLYIKFLPYLTFERSIEVRSLDTQDARRLEELDKENKELKKEMQEIRKDLDSRKGADDTLNKLFNDPDVQQMLLKKLKELEGKKG